MPQIIQFKDDGVWHDWVPTWSWFGLTGPALKAMPWFPYLQLDESDHLSDHRIDRPRATTEVTTKSTGKTMKKRKAAANPAPAPAGAGTAAAVAA